MLSLRFSTLLVVLLMSVCLSAGCAWGVVTDGSTGEPISGATISFHDAQGNSGTAVTSQQGLYAFAAQNGSLPAKGTATFEIMAPGYERLTEQREVGYDGGQLWEVQHFALRPVPEFSVRPIVIIPSDVALLPSDVEVRDSVDEAMAELQRWLAGKAEGHTFTLAPAQIIHSSQPDEWFKTEPDGRHVSQSWSRVDEVLAQSMLGGLCPAGFVNVVWVSTGSEGGFNGGTRCGAIIEHEPDWPATSGPGSAGVATFGEWNLDAILGTDEQCARESEWGPGVCTRNHQMGVLVHEMLHGFGMNHTCAEDQWGDILTPEQCDDLVMENPGSYPSGGFTDQELEILLRSPFMNGVQP